jgi:hypothetical protein
MICVLACCASMQTPSIYNATHLHGLGALCWETAMQPPLNKNVPLPWGNGIAVALSRLRGTRSGRDWVWLQGQDSNLRPSGYEPDALPSAPPCDRLCGSSGLLALLNEKQIRTPNLDLGWNAANAPITHALHTKWQLISQQQGDFCRTSKLLDQFSVFCDLGIHARILNVVFSLCQTLCLAHIKHGVIDYLP